MHSVRPALLLTLASMAWLHVRAATVLLDFETPGDVARWHDERATTLGSDKKLERAERFAASGASSLCFWTAAWRPAEHDGAQQWPAFEGTPPITDWSAYDRLVFEVVNATAAPQRLMLFITDSKQPTRSGLLVRQHLPPTGHAQVVVELKAGLAGRKVDPADIRTLHVFTEDPPEDMTLYLDRFLLLKPGEAIPGVPAPFLRDFATLQATGLDAVQKEIGATAARLKQSLAGAPALLAWSAAETAALLARVASLRERLDKAETAVLDVPQDMERLRGTAARLEALSALHLAFERIRPRVQAPAAVPVAATVGFASPTAKVLPRDATVALNLGDGLAVSLARHEKESFQVVVVPRAEALQQVSVRLGDLRDARGHVFSRTAIRAVPVGYVQTKSEPPYRSPHVGWWPDPILEFLSAADIAPWDAQAFWVRVAAPADQPAGLYTGALEVWVGETAQFRFALTIRVYDFAVPAASPLPLAITFWPHDYPESATQAEQQAWRTQPDYPINAWKAHKDRWADFLADYYITFDSLYGYKEWAPDFEVLTRLKQQGRLGRFNLGYYAKASDTEANAWGMAETLDRLRPRYERARQLGLLGHAYIYGCDENPKDAFPGVERAAAAIKEAFPGVLVMTTTYDDTFGLDSVVKSVDAWCPLTPKFDPAKATAARAAGKQVWWYICCGPHHPHANVFVEYPALDGRLLMGALTAKYRPDGFLYYQISIWNSRKPITGGPFTDWDPRSWTTYHGDGSWTCVGPGGTPLPTIRLENFRDGLEDYAYVLALEAAVNRAEATTDERAARADWLTAAKAALAVPESVAKSLTEYAADPAALYAWRNRIAELIEAAQR